MDVLKRIHFDFIKQNSAICINTFEILLSVFHSFHLPLLFYITVRLFALISILL